VFSVNLGIHANVFAAEFIVLMDSAFLLIEDSFFIYT